MAFLKAIRYVGAEEEYWYARLCANCAKVIFEPGSIESYETTDVFINSRDFYEREGIGLYEMGVEILVHEDLVEKYGGDWQ